MADITVQGLADTGDRRTTWHVFLALAAGATLLPFVAAPLTASVLPDDTAGYLWFVVLSFLAGNFHVATTGWFFADREMRQHFGRNRVRYVVIPALVVVTTSVSNKNGALFPYVLAAYYSWQLWHYQKQNVGLLSFIAAGTNKVPVSVWERRALMLAWVPAGIVPPLKILLPVQLFHEVHPWGLLAYGPVVVAFCVAVARTSDLRTNLVRLTFLFSGAAFFVPIYVFSNPVAATASFGIAHGLQYFVFMGAVSIARRTMIGMAGLIGLAVAGGMALDHLQVLGGLFIGLVSVHYLYDAHIWRLREPFQRAFMRKRFAFVFER